MPRLTSIRYLLIAVPLVVMAAGCEDSVSGPTGAEDFDPQPGHALLAPGSDITLRAEAEDYAPGSPVDLVLENGSAETVGYNLCFHALEQRVGDDWILEEDSRICTTHLNLLAPGSSAQYEATIPEGLASGEYRFRVALYLMEQEGHRDQVSASFQISD